MGETAPLLFTVSTAYALTGNVNQQMDSLPFLIFNDIQSPRTAIISQGWGAALMLVALVLILNIVARAIARRSRLA
jgi:phosphate transport system permease protein